VSVIVLALLLTLTSSPRSDSLAKQTADHELEMFGLLNFGYDCIGDSHELIAVETVIPLPLLTELLETLDRVEIRLDGEVVNVLTPMDLVLLYCSEEKGNSEHADVLVPVAHEHFLIAPGEYELVASAILHDGSLRTLYREDNFFASELLLEARFRMRFANTVLRLQLEAAEKVVGLYACADPILFEQDSAGILPLPPGRDELLCARLSQYQDYLSSSLVKQGLPLLHPEGRVVEKALVERLVAAREMLAYKARGNTARNVVDETLTLVTHALDRTNAMLLEKRMELDHVGSSPTKIYVYPEKTRARLKARVIELEGQQRSLAELLSKMREQWETVPGFAGMWWEFANED